MRILFLGTSCAIPTRLRALPSVAVVYDGEVLLFDCGEGTQRQMLHAGLKLTRVRHVMISHLHADDVLGLPGLLISRGFIGGKDPLTVYGPPGLTEFLDFVLKSTHAFLDYPLEVRESEGGELYADESFRLVAEPLKHRSFCLGFAFVESDRPGRFDAERAKKLGIPPGPVYGRLKAGGEVRLPDGRVVRGSDLVGPPIPGRKVAYVVDTVPCPGAYRLAQDADLVIFDSTYAAANQDEGKEYGHSTSLQAFKVAKRSGAKRLALFHFSPRYEDPGVLLEGLPTDGPELLLAEDLLEVEIPRRAPGE